MDTKWTPGPWVVEDPIWVDINGHQHKAWCIGNAETGTAVVILPEEDVTDESLSERLDTARLIAAAPEMYEALEAMVKEVEFGASIRGGEGHLSAVATLARAALAKARGES